MWPLPVSAILFQSFGFLDPQNCVIIWLSNILALSVHELNKGYCRKAFVWNSRFPIANDVGDEIRFTPVCFA